jgi:uncharacterized cupredoxin-like copper-binding protein
MTTEEKTTEASAEPDAGDAPVETGGGDGSDTGTAPIARAHPYRDRYLVPLLFPLIVVAGIIIFVLNVSRIFIATHGTGAVIIGTVITLLILFGATAMSVAPRVRTSSAGLTVVLALVAVTGLGWLMIGAAEEHGEEVVELGPAVSESKIDALATLAFRPDEIELPFDPAAEYSVANITLENVAAGSHTLAFDDQNVVWPEIIEVAAAGDSVSQKAGFPAEGDYSFYCSVPTHREAGMEGVITVTADLEPQPVEEGGAEEGAGGEAPAP